MKIHKNLINIWVLNIYINIYIYMWYLFYNYISLVCYFFKIIIFMSIIYYTIKMSKHIYYWGLVSISYLIENNLDGYKLSNEYILVIHLVILFICLNYIILMVIYWWKSKLSKINKYNNNEMYILYSCCLIGFVWSYINFNYVIWWIVIDITELVFMVSLVSLSIIFHYQIIVLNDKQDNVVSMILVIMSVTYFLEKNTRNLIHGDLYFYKDISRLYIIWMVCFIYHKSLYNWNNWLYVNYILKFKRIQFIYLLSSFCVICNLGGYILWMKTIDFLLYFIITSWNIINIYINICNIFITYLIYNTNNVCQFSYFMIIVILSSNKNIANHYIYLWLSYIIIIVQSLNINAQYLWFIAYQWGIIGLIAFL